MMHSPPELSESGLKALTATAIAVVAWLQWGHKVGKLIAVTISVWAFIVQSLAAWGRKRKQQKEICVMVGIDNLKKIVSVVAVLGSIGGKTLEDGKVDVKDIALITTLIPVFPLMLSIDFAVLMPEAGDLTLSESEELVAHFKSTFDIPQDIEVKIEAVLSICVKFASLVAELIALFKKPV